VQLLWLNLVTKGIQDVALAFEGGEPDTMKRPPRDPKEGVFNRLMLQETLVAGMVTALLAYGFFWVLVKEYGMNEFDARNRLFLMMVLIENYHTFNCRSEYLSVFRIPLSRNWLLLLGVVLAQVIHIGAMFLPWTQKVLRVAPVSLAEWLAPFGFSALILLTMEIFKVVVHGRSIAWAKLSTESKE
jgi:magnesium-transporting ATPase (P-type)